MIGKTRLTRRSALLGLGAAALATKVPYTWAAAAAPITIVINQSPWFDSFRKTVELYEKETGNKVNLDVNPFAGSLEKQRNSVRASQGDYDILIMNSGWFAEMYFGGFVTAITDIDPSFKLDPDVFTLGDTIYFDPEKKTMSPSGKLMSVPIQPNIPMLYYRGDLYKEKGLKPVETFEDLYNNAKALQDPPKMYGIVQRGARGPHTVSYDFYPVPLSASAAASSRIRRPATTPSRSTTTRARKRWTTTSDWPRRPAIRRPRLSTRRKSSRRW